MAERANKKYIWMSRVCFVLASISFFVHFLIIPDGGMGVEQSDVERYIFYKVIVGLLFLLLVFSSFVLWVIFLKKEKLFNKEIIIVAIYFIITLIFSCFVLDGTYAYYLRYHGITGEELMKIYQEKR